METQQTEKCPKCGGENEKGTRICRHCQVDLKDYKIMYYWVKRHKVFTGLAILGLIIFLIVTSKGEDKKIAKSSKQEVQVQATSKPQEQTQQATDDNVKSSQRNQSASPTKTLSEEDQLKQLVSKQLKSTTSGGKERIRKIEVIEQYDGGWGVFTEYNADDVMTANLTKKSIELDMTDLYKALYTSGKNISSASVTAYLTLVDKYGKESDSVVYGTILDKSEADKVNWNMDRSYLGLNIMPNVWTTKFINAEFQ